MPINWENRIRDGILYAVASFAFFSALAFLYDIPDVTAQFMFVLFLIPWWYFTVKALNRLFPKFFGNYDYMAYEISRTEDTAHGKIPSSQTGGGAGGAQ